MSRLLRKIILSDVIQKLALTSLQKNGRFVIALWHYRSACRHNIHITVDAIHAIIKITQNEHLLESDKNTKTHLKLRIIFA